MGNSTDIRLSVEIPMTYAALLTEEFALAMHDLPPIYAQLQLVLFILE